MRIGTMSNAVNDGTVEEVVAEAQACRDLGADTFWAPQIFGHDTLTALAVVATKVPGLEYGTAVVPTFPRYPAMLAQQALTLSQITGGKLCLGIGLSHRIVVEGMWGMSYDKPVRHMREYLSVLMPLLDGRPVQFEGRDYTARLGLSITGIPRPSVVVAALGTQMLRVTGELADGTSTWCVGPNTLRDHIVPTLRQAAADAGRPAPRVVCSLPISVTDDVDAARTRAAQVFAVYTHLPSYRAMMDKEGVPDASGLAIVGSEAEVGERLDELAAIGVTDFNAGLFSGDPEEIARTKALLRGRLA